MRNSEKLAAVKYVLEHGSNRIIIEHNTELGGVINRIERWPEIHRALSVLVGYVENGQLVPGLLPRDSHTDYARELITRFPPSATEFPRDLFGSLQSEIDRVCQNVPIAVHVLEQMSPEWSDSTFTAEFPGRLLLTEFQETVSEVKTVVDMIKIGDQVTHVWTDFGSAVFGFDVDNNMALTILNAVVLGAEQLRNITAGFNRETVESYFRLFSRINQSLHDEPLDEDLIRDDVIQSGIASYANGRIQVDIPEDIDPEQRNGIDLAIPRLAGVSDRGWNVYCSNPSAGQGGTSISIVAHTVSIALPPAPLPGDDTDELSAP